MVNTSDKLFNELYKLLVEVMAIEMNYIYQEYRNEVVVGPGINMVGLDTVLKWASRKHQETGVVLLSDLVVKRLKEVFGEIKINDIISIIGLNYRNTYHGNLKSFVVDVLGFEFVEKVSKFGRNRDIYDKLIGEYLDRVEVLKKRFEGHHIPTKKWDEAISFLAEIGEKS